MKITKNLENGQTQTSLSPEFDLATWTVKPISKDRERINDRVKASDPLKSAVINEETYSCYLWNGKVINSVVGGWNKKIYVSVA
jgi:hypothetical protein